MKASQQHSQEDSYWKAVLSLLKKVLFVWFIVSFGFGIIIGQFLNQFHLGGYPIGFWFANQGSIYIFILLIFFYAYQMGKIDKEFDVHED